MIMDATVVSAITDAIDWTTIITGVGAVATAAVSVYLAIKGAKMILGAVRGL